MKPHLVWSEPHQHVTTADRVMADLRASLIARGQDAGTTWGDFKAAMQRLGVSDSAPLGGIEFGMGQSGSGRIVADEEDGGYVVREIR